MRVARALLNRGSATAPQLAAELDLTSQGVRRHLDALAAAGFIEAGARPPFGPLPLRGRGRPPKVYFLTDRGRDVFESTYDDLAVEALRFLAETAGPEQVAAFAEHRAGQLRQRYADAAGDAEELADRMSVDGFAASVVTNEAGEAVQLCQHHCPVGHVAAEFPQLCEAETAAIGEILGRHVTRLATIAHGDGVCTSVLGPPVAQPMPASGPAGPAAAGPETGAGTRTTTGQADDRKAAS